MADGKVQLVRRVSIVGVSILFGLSACGGDGQQSAGEECRPVPDAEEPSACAWKVEGTKAWFFVSGLEPGTDVRVGTQEGFVEGTVGDDGTYGGEEQASGDRAEKAIDAGRPVDTYTVRGTSASGAEVVLPLDQ